MKRQLAFVLFISLFAAFVFSSTLIVGGCGGDGGGGGGVVVDGGPTPLATGTFTKTESLGSGFSWSSPFVLNPEVREQHLFFAQDIKGSGYIESFSLRYYNDEAVSTNCPDVTIKMGHTSLSALTTTFANNVEQGRGSLVTVLAGAVTIPAGSAGDYFTITLDQPFQYNGVDNLVVEFVRTAACDNNIELDSTDVVYPNVSLQNPSSGAATGNLYNNYPNAKFTFAGGDNAVIPTAGITSGNSYPFNLNPAVGRKVQLLYTAGAIDGSGPITGIGMIVGWLATTEQEYTMTVRLGHSTLADLTTTYDNNFSDTPVTVASGVVFKVPADVPVGETLWFPLPDGTFTYNGSDNLIVEIDVTDNSSATGITWWRHNSPVGNDVRLFGDTGAATGDGVDQMGYHIEFRFNGGTMDVITDGWVISYIIPVGNLPEYIVQILYDNTSLGTGGQITSLGFRLGGNANAFDHTDVNLVLGHTTLSTLGTASLAANIESDRTAAFSGMISIPAGLKAGDWVEVPLAMPFTYDPTKNLVVQWDAPAFATTNPSIGHTSATGRYAGHVEANIGDRTSDVSNASGDFVLDMSLTLNK